MESDDFGEFMSNVSNEIDRGDNIALTVMDYNSNRNDEDSSIQHRELHHDEGNTATTINNQVVFNSIPPLSNGKVVCLHEATIY